MALGKFPIFYELLPEGSPSQHQMALLNLKRIPAILPIEFAVTTASSVVLVKKRNSIKEISTERVLNPAFKKNLLNL